MYVIIVDDELLMKEDKYLRVYTRESNVLKYALQLQADNPKSEVQIGKIDTYCIEPLTESHVERYRQLGIQTRRIPRIKTCKNGCGREFPSKGNKQFCSERCHYYYLKEKGKDQ